MRVSDGWLPMRDPAKRYNRLLDAAGIDANAQLRLDAVRTRITDLTFQAVEEYGCGIALDVGAGSLVFANELHRFFSTYVTLDYEIRSSKLNVRGDGQNLPFAAGTFDTLISIDVLEHVQNPWQMFKESARVLVPGGVIVLVTPFFFWAHEEPFDFYRVSKYGLVHLCEKNDLELLRIEPTCGFIAAVGLLGTIAITRMFHRVPSVLALILKVSNVFQRYVLLPIDSHVDRSKRFAQGHLIVAKKIE